MELPPGDWSALGAPGSEQTTTMRGAAFRPEYVQWSLRHRNLRRTSGVPLNNIFWCAAVIKDVAADALAPQKGRGPLGKRQTTSSCVKMLIAT